MKVKTKSFMISVLMLIAFVFGVFAFMPTTTMAKADESEYVPVTGISFSSVYNELDVDRFITNTVTIEPADATNKTIKYTSSDYSVAVVDPSTGRITGMSEGTAIITATLKDGENTFVATTEVKVIEGCGRSDSVFFKLGNDEEIIHYVQNGSKPRFPEVKKDGYVFLGWYKDNAYTTPWDMENDVTKTGNHTYIYAKWIAEGDYVERTGIAFENSEITYTGIEYMTGAYRTFIPLTVYSVPENASIPLGKLAWMVEDDSIVELGSQEGNRIYYRGLKAGTTTITAYTLDGKFSASIKVNVVLNDNRELTLSQTEKTYDLKQASFYDLVANLTTTDGSPIGNSTILWTVSDPSIVEFKLGSGVTNRGIYRGLKEGTATITATTYDGKHSATFTITVTDTRYLEFAQSKYDYSMGNTDDFVELKAVTNAWGLIWTVDDPGIVEIDADNSDTVRYKGVNNGTTTIRVRTEDGLYSASCEVQVVGLIVRRVSIGMQLPKDQLTILESNNSIKDEGVGFTVQPLVWFVKNGNEWDNISDNTAKFEEGKEYRLIFKYAIQTFTMEDALGNTKILINGEYYDAYHSMSGEDHTYQVEFTALPFHTHTVSDTYNGWSEDQHWKKCTDPDCPSPWDTMEDMELHSNANASCANAVGLVCDVCGCTYDLAPSLIEGMHKLVWKEAVAPTCSAKGTVEHFECTVCNEWFDADGLAILEEDRTVAINADNHKFSAWNTAVEATCTQTGTVAHKQCTLCNKYFGSDGVTEIVDITIDTIAHTYGETWKTDGNNHWRECTCGHKGYVEEHNPDRANATETDPIKCTVCGYVITPALGHTTHTPKVEWENNETHHWHDCTGCEGQELEKAPHVDSDNNGKCDTCEYDMPTTPGGGSGSETPEKPDEPKDGLGTGAIVGIAVGSVAVAGVGGFALVWFVIKKKTWAEFLAIFKKK